MASKYYAVIEEAQRGQSADTRQFEFDRLRPTTWKARIAQHLTQKLMPAFLWVCREYFPVVRLGGVTWATRKADVENVLKNFDTFEVPYGPEMREIAGGCDFVLGVDGPAQQRQNAIIRRIIVDGDGERCRRWSQLFAQSLIDGGAGRLDVVTDFALRIPTEICRRYFGLGVADPNRFAEWAIAVSALLFADPTGDPVKRSLALAGAARLRHVINVAIARAENEGPFDFKEATLVERLVTLQTSDPLLGLTRDEIRSIVLGLVVGFIPTNGLAAANMLELLFKRPDSRRMAFDAAAMDDKRAWEAMQRVVREAGRLNPALSPGQWRVAKRTTKISGTEIEAGATVMVATASAVRDSRSVDHPNQFDPSRNGDADLVFGYNTHKCLGEHLAITIITSMFLVLFEQHELRLANDCHGKMSRTGYFPSRMDVKYSTPNAEQSMILICIPSTSNAPLVDLEAAVEALGNPAFQEIARSLNSTNRVHFASGSIVTTGDGNTGCPCLILEFNVDGTRERAINMFSQSEFGWLESLVRLVRPGDPRQLIEILRAHRVDLHFRPWGTTGLNFFGTGDFPVASIAKQAELRTQVELKMTAFLSDTTSERSGLGQRAPLVLSGIRKALRMDAELSGLDAFLVQPSRKFLPVSVWRKPESFWAPLRQVLSGGLTKTLLIAFVPLLILSIIISRLALATPAGGIWTTLAYAALIFTLATILALCLVAAIVAFGYFIFRRAERREVADDQAPDHDRLQAIVARENNLGHRQNHIIAVSALKRGIARRLAFAFSMWGIRQSLYWFRPGFVVTMGTIHYAKWFRMPGSRKLIFQSNYDGSWESYLEDFITRAHPGQTAAWSNGEGFPKSKKLIQDGAKDGDRFKRWVRRQQIPTAFWYSRFPDKTTREIRINALIHDGLARAHTESAARSWVDLVRSTQRQSYELESEEIQSLVFRGLKNARYTACIPFLLPEMEIARQIWLKPLLASLTFGKFPTSDKALYLALSARGLGKFGQNANADERPEIERAFTGAFAAGMASRGAILGDEGPDGYYSNWRWSDGSERGADTPTSDGVLLIYAANPDLLEARIKMHVNELRQAGGALAHSIIRTVPLDSEGKIETNTRAAPAYEHFGFRDGISSPVIKGTEQFSPHHKPEDVVEPGEFILGYANNQGQVAPSVMVSALSDLGDNLPVAADRISFGFADFQTCDDLLSERDFGRNGSFLVIRQLAQNAPSFVEFTEAKADELISKYGAERLRETVGDVVDGEWVAAKLMGRWRDGRPLIGNPMRSNRDTPKSPDNDFSFGRDDPRGHACPLGAHIRRANPRDSFEPDDPLERMITKRHSLMRRGRTYFYDPKSGEYPPFQPASEPERGLLFMALCADIERQFELVQQSWLGAPDFHGLRNEIDPITTPSGATHAREFTIPTVSGPLIMSGMQSFVEMHGGGYFFLPSRSALRYLCSFGGSIADRSVAPVL